MKSSLLFRSLAILLLGLGVSHGNAAPVDSPVASSGVTTVLKWKDGKKAVFLLMFDDSAPSAMKTVIPELKKRGMSGTFYVVPGGGPYKAAQKAWETDLPGPGIIYANHTFTHKGATTSAQLDEELAKCNEGIAKCYPGLKQPRLISFGKPGGVPWTVTKDELNTALAKYNLIDRPPFKGYPINYKTTEAMLALVDTALAKGEMEYNVFHGVGGDWLVTPLDVFTALLDKLEANKEQLWVTDAISWHQYAAERKGAEVKVLEVSKSRIRIRLTSKEDPVFYDLPLTLSTQVPPEWKQCRVTQGGKSTTIPAAGGVVRYTAVPGAEEIMLQPAAGG